MIRSDKNSFKELFDGLAEYYRQDHLSKPALQIYFASLERFSLDQINTAASAHVSDVKSGQFFPKAADFIRHLEGGEITADMIIASAKLKETPLGCLCAIQIGSWDLDNQDAFYLRQRAAECLQLLPEWKARSASGDYSDHEISIMLKYDVHPLTPFAFGLAAPANPDQLIQKFINVQSSERHLKFIEPVYVSSDDDKAVPMNEEVKKIIAQISEEMS